MRRVRDFGYPVRHDPVELRRAAVGVEIIHPPDPGPGGARPWRSPSPAEQGLPLVCCPSLDPRQAEVEPREPRESVPGRTMPLIWLPGGVRLGSGVHEPRSDLTIRRLKDAPTRGYCTAAGGRRSSRSRTCRLEARRHHHGVDQSPGGSARRTPPAARSLRVRRSATPRLLVRLDAPVGQRESMSERSDRVGRAARSMNITPRPLCAGG